MKRLFKPKQQQQQEQERGEGEQASPPPSSSTPTKQPKSKSKDASKNKSVEEQLAEAKQQISVEKAGKRKLFHSLVKLANELSQLQTEQQKKRSKEQRTTAWYDGGMWRAPQVLPNIYSGSLRVPIGTFEGSSNNKENNISPKQARPHKSREAVTLSDLFFNLVVVTALTRAGTSLCSTETGQIHLPGFFYFAVFWNVWYKETSYSTRFDTTDLSAQATTLLTCFVLLFASLSTAAPLLSKDANRIMYMAASVAILHCCLHVRVLWTQRRGSANRLTVHVSHYAIYNIVVTLLEAASWLVGVWIFPVDWEYRWVIFVVALLLGLRIPRSFLANDFHRACTKRGVLFILLLGFMLQSVVVVASEFFAYQTPTLEQYSFIGAVCLMLFCIKLLYVDDSDTLAQDHALLVNRWAAFFFSVGQFALLLSTTILGSGLNLLTHSYLAATASLPGPEKNLVCAGFSATLLSTAFIKSMHLKRVPLDRRQRAYFVTAYVIQSVVVLAVVTITAYMSVAEVSGFLEYLMQTDIQLLFGLSLAALFCVFMCWLDAGVALALYDSAQDSRSFLVRPFGFWWCLRPDVSDDLIENALERDPSGGRRRLSELSPLLGSSIAERLNDEDYDSLVPSASYQ